VTEEGGTVSESSTSPDPAPPSIRGFCTPPALAELIRDLYLDERTGTLVLTRGGAVKSILMERGMIVGVTSSLEDERLARHLARRGAITAEEAQALQGLADAQCAEALLKRGAISLPGLQEGLRELAQQALTGLFRWDDLEYRFEEGPVPAGPVEANVVVSFELIIRALRSMAAFEPIRDALLRQDRGLRFSDQLYLPFDRLSLTPVEGFLVSRIDGQARVRDILAQVPPSEEEAAARFVFGLLILGLAHFVPPVGTGPLSCGDLVRGEEEKRRREERERAEILDAYRRAREGKPTDLLGVEPGSTPERIKSAYLERKERFSASRFLKKVRTDLREELQIIEARLLEAFLETGTEKLGAARPPAGGNERVVNLNLEQLAMRKELTKTEKQSVEEEKTRLAEQFLAKARDYWKMGDYFNCIRYCEFASSHNDKSPAVFSLLGQALSRNPDYRWQKRAEVALQRAAELEPFNPNHFVALGDFYRSHGLAAKARKHYEKAIEILPSQPQALEALRELKNTKA
jgi:tetratricopeptide (TPR) repeat protein